MLLKIRGPSQGCETQIREHFSRNKNGQEEDPPR
uniref:Uncharacterized protein n=1 Tax=Heterorhabditis bacteriophora TaxID=37862 RepID=A0A1I7X2X6_HETBA